MREFLLKTSVLERMSASVCEALTGHAGAQEMLERLERENLFVVPLDDERLWYRYHHLFADFLRGRLGRESPELTGELHLRASGWYEDNGHLAEAIGHALSAPDHERAARLIERGVKHAWSRGEGPTVLRWLEALPTEAKRRRRVQPGDRSQALRLGKHGEDPHQQPLPQVGGAQPHPGGGPCLRDEPPLAGSLRHEHSLPFGRTVDLHPRSTLRPMPLQPTSRYSDGGS